MRDDTDADRDEELQSALDPHRREERDHVTAEVAARLRRRGVHLTDQETSEQLVELLDAIERFERTVVAKGGDLMVDSGNAPQPDDPAFVLPRRESGESVASYIDRIDAAAQALRDR